jgi:hypothetical protein
VFSLQACKESVHVVHHAWPVGLWTAVGLCCPLCLLVFMLLCCRCHCRFCVSESHITDTPPLWRLLVQFLCSPRHILLSVGRPHFTVKVPVTSNPPLPATAYIPGTALPDVM